MILAVDLVLDVVALLGGAATALTILGALFAIVALIYLWRPQVKHAFDSYPIDAPTS